MQAWKKPAPGALEEIRIFLNTWLLSTKTRQADDRLDKFLVEPVKSASIFPGRDAVPVEYIEPLRHLRDDLRLVVHSPQNEVGRLNKWLRDYPLQVQVQIQDTSTTLEITYRCQLEENPISQILSTVVQAIASGEWSRLKACPDCQLIFYDHTRSHTKVWCDMQAGGSDGRACGTIAKVQRYRARQRTALSDEK